MFENWNRFVQETTERLTDTKETERKGELCGHNPEKNAEGCITSGKGTR